MKLNIIDSKDREITGYNNINLLSKTYVSQISEIMDYSCEEIIISECVNTLAEKEFRELLPLLCSKLSSSNGSINISTYDIEYLCTLANKTQHLNAILPKINSCITAGELINMLKVYSIHILSLSSSGGLLNIVGTKVIHETDE